MSNEIDLFKEYYANTLIVQYHDKPKAIATIKLLVDLVFDNLIWMQIRDGFDWRTAVGEQLDIIGKWVGVSRVFNINLITSPKLAYPQYSRLLPVDLTSDLQGGYSTYDNFDTLEGGQLRYNDLQTVENKLDDDAYRTIIGLKIIYNSINHTKGEIDEAIFDYFGQYLYTKDYPTTSTSSLAYYRFYTDKEFKHLFGVVYPNAFDHYQGDAGYYRFFRTNSTQVIAQEYCKPIEHVQGKLYRLKYSSVYTTWDTNNYMLTYNYPSKYSQIMQFAEYKGVLPVPLGTKLQITQIGV